MDTASVHHIEILVQDGEAVSREFVSKYGFHLLARSSRFLVKQWVVKSHNAHFVITQSELSLRHNIKNTTDIPTDRDRVQWDDPYVVPSELEYRGSQSHVIDTVNNVALKVKNVRACLQRFRASGASVLKSETKIVDENGEVELAIVKSCVGNVIHTLINTDNYRGAFLPHYKVTEHNDTRGETECINLAYFDHVTFACETGSSSRVLRWYEECLGMKRFLMNSDEDEDGFVIDTTDIGLRLKAMEYWRCAEVGVTTPQTSEGVNSIKFVIAEALPDQGPNQVDTFLTEHGGPGIQHVGLHTRDIVTAVSTLMTRGVDFAEPPYTYYTEIGKLEDIERIGQSVAILKTNGILVDMETDHYDGQDQQKRYLMQKFTKPLFGRNTFFLEVIHRCGATGFGSGNIIALWRSVQAYMSSQGTLAPPTKSS